MSTDSELRARGRSAQDAKGGASSVRAAMSARKDQQTVVRSRLAVARVAAGVTQAEAAERIGIGLATYRRLERGQVENPPLRYLVNAAIMFGVDVDDVIDDRWREWLPLDQGV